MDTIVCTCEIFWNTNFNKFQSILRKEVFLAIYESFRADLRTFICREMRTLFEPLAASCGLITTLKFGFLMQCVI